MVAKRDASEMSMIPLKLYADDAFEHPTWIGSQQYMHYYKYPDAEAVADKLVQFLDQSLAKQTI